ncbi:hypothetical protein B4113_1468 [Geobacillus sp. B4113_201601]|nr:hypothetical protein B4113_1468 [Geobacillus sp. B4113_201601]
MGAAAAKNGSAAPSDLRRRLCRQETASYFYYKASFVNCKYSDRKRAGRRLFKG